MSVHLKHSEIKCFPLPLYRLHLTHKHTLILLHSNNSNITLLLEKRIIRNNNLNKICFTFLKSVLFLVTFLSNWFLVGHSVFRSRSINRISACWRWHQVGFGTIRARSARNRRFTSRSIYVPPMTRLITINDHVMPRGSVRLPLFFSPGDHVKALAS